MLGAPLALLLAYHSLTALFRQLRVFYLRSQFRQLTRRELGSRPPIQMQPRVYMSLRRRRFNVARDHRVYYRAVARAARQPDLVERARQPGLVAQTNPEAYLTAALLA